MGMNEFYKILNDKKSGCSEIVMKSLKYLSKLEDKKEVSEICEKIASAHKGMLGVVNIMKLTKIHGVQRVLKAVERSNKLTSEKLSELVEGKIVTTISKSGIVYNGIKTASKVYVLESLPGGEGIECAKNLAKFLKNVEILHDAEMSLAVKNSDLIVCGADSMDSSGFTNKIGTLPLALLSNYFKKRFIVASPLYKAGRVVEAYPFEFIPSKLATLLTEKGITKWEFCKFTLQV